VPEKRPFMNRDDVARLLPPTSKGEPVKGKTVSTYLYESRPLVGRGVRERPGRYAGHPFPEPDGYHGKAPWWCWERQDEVREWAASRPGQGVGGGRPRQSD
jgi:hypothetical protein